MPELPEVESYARALKKEYVGKDISRVVFHRDNIRSALDKKGLCAALELHELTDVFRDGKRLVLKTSGGEVLISLGMSGSFIPAHSTPTKHEHVTLHFADGTMLGYIDPRRFGTWEVRERILPHRADPLSEASLNKLFRERRFTKSSRSIKDLLLDQHEIGGVGNIYALEALHLAGVDPRRKVSNVSKTEFTSIAKHLPKVLLQAIDRGGSTVSTYRRLHGDTGDFQELHRVYDREDEKCLKRACSGTIVRIPQGGRSSWYCPECQN
jgi:formamidopyrimidine-DNA glycosylase